MALITCPECGNQVSDKAKTCPNCGIPIDTKVCCPNCGSSDVQIISGASKAASVLAFGILAANKVKSSYKCKSCGHKF